MNTPNFVHMPLVGEKYMNDAWELWLGQIVTNLQQTFSDSGYLIPSLTTADINKLDITNDRCILVRDSSINKLKVSLGGAWETITST